MKKPPSYRTSILPRTKVNVPMPPVKTPRSHEDIPCIELKLEDVATMEKNLAVQVEFRGRSYIIMPQEWQERYENAWVIQQVRAGNVEEKQL